MGKEIAAVPFDYSTVSKDDKGKLLCLAREIKAEKDRYAASGMKIGEAISAAHAILAHRGDGEFGAWVTSEFGFSRQSAYNLMYAWERFGDCPTVGQSFDAKALYDLSSPKAPPEAVQEAIKLADKGVQITHDKAKELLKKFRVAVDKPPPEDLGKCPNCAGKRWKKQDDGAMVCKKCGHPHGEPVGERDVDRLGDQRAVTVKTIEATMRAFGDLDTLCHKEQEHEDAIATCKTLLKTAKGWK